jgi:hypothetical protein
MKQLSGCLFHAQNMLHGKKLCKEIKADRL